MAPSIHTREQAKAYARQRRAAYAARQKIISHSAALECVAHECGYADWNTMSARLSKAPERPLQVGDRVKGLYLNKPFAGYVLGLREMGAGRSYDVTIDFDEAVDVIEFDSFASFRKRISATISAAGISYAKTSNGNPHLIVESDHAGGMV